MKEVMAFLAENWVVGVSTSIALVLFIYSFFSIRLLLNCRKIGYDVGVSCMIPVVNLFIFFRKAYFKHALKKKGIEEDEELIEL